MNPSIEDIRGGGYTGVRKDDTALRNGTPRVTEVFRRESDGTFWWAHQVRDQPPLIVQVEPVTVNGTLTYHEVTAGLAK